MENNSQLLKFLFTAYLQFALDRGSQKNSASFVCFQTALLNASNRLQKHNTAANNFIKTTGTITSLSVTAL